MPKKYKIDLVVDNKSTGSHEIIKSEVKEEISSAYFIISKKIKDLSLYNPECEIFIDINELNENEEEF